MRVRGARGVQQPVAMRVAAAVRAPRRRRGRVVGRVALAAPAVADIVTCVEGGPCIDVPLASLGHFIMTRANIVKRFMLHTFKSLSNEFKKTART